MSLPRFANYIAGQFTEPAGQRWLPVFEPATGTVYAEVADSAALDARAAVDASVAAAREAARCTPEQRAAWLDAIASAIETRLDAFAEAESRDTGKPLALARSVDIPRAVANFRFFASMARCFGSEAFETGPQRMHVVLRQALGAVACISPWNLPLYLLSWKVAPALACGNTVVAKPSEITPATAAMLAEVIHTLGLPAGLFNLLQGHGQRAGAALVADPRIKAVSFTGSTAVGRQIAGVSAPMLRKLSLELGGKNPTLVFADADFDRAVSESVRAAFANQGQICLCGARILVEKRIYADFRAAFLEKVAALKVGDPLHADTDQGALVSQAHLDKVLGCIQRAREEGGRVLTGGERLHLPGRLADGWYIAPTVIDQLDYLCPTNTDEIFGPVVTLMPFEDEAQALLYANHGDYGLAASVWTRDVHRIQRLQRGLIAGLVWINCWMERDLRVPFGGQRASGLGREGGAEAMRFFTEAKTVTTWNPELPA